MVHFELAKWVTREMGEAKAEAVIAFTQLCVVVPLDTPTAVTAAEFSAQHHLSVADAILYATAQRHDAELLTCDRHFEGLPGVQYFAK
jgi:predicted nucleic acid-binding protein